MTQFIRNAIAGIALSLTLLGAQAAADAIAWRNAASDADVEAAFAQARTEAKPVFVYWGAQWCPPCNQVKATLFNRADFIERTRAFVPVYVDGDSPGAQKLGTRFKVRGYPTMVLFNPQGAELVRLPGEADARQVMSVLQLGMSGGRPVKEVLADALVGQRKLTANEWKLLAFYSWETDEDRLVPAADRPATLVALAAACPPAHAQTATRLWLKALAASNDGQGVRADPALRRRVLAVLADPASSRTLVDVLSNSAAEITRAISTPQAGGQRAAVVTAFDAAMRRLAGDATLSRADRITALGARVELARLDLPANARDVKLGAALLRDLRAHVARDDRDITDGYERQAVIPSGAYLLAQAGLVGESDRLLKANLPRSHSPYYLMSQLASNARASGNVQQALAWYAQAFDQSQGAATRLQWGASYLAALVDLAPQDVARIESVANQIFGEAARQPDAFHERSARSLQRVAAKLTGWAKGGEQVEAWHRVQGQIEPVCRKLPVADPQRAVCESLLPGKAS
jgi:thioredoxin-related protein